jgi:hydrogenase expression/formation protein HypC
MCLAIPAKVLEVQGDVAKVDFGQGIARDVNVMLVEAHVGEYVLVHAGYAIQVIDQEAAEETLRLWREILKYEG